MRSLGQFEQRYLSIVQHPEISGFDLTTPMTGSEIGGFHKREQLWETRDRHPEYPATQLPGRPVWRHVTNLFWARHVDSLDEMPGLIVFGDVRWRGLPLHIQNWPHNAKNDRRIGAIFTLGALPSYRAQEAALAGGAMPLELRREGLERPEEEWARLKPSWEKAGWDVNDYERRAYKVVEIAELELQPRPG